MLAPAPRSLRLVPSAFDPLHALGLLDAHGDDLLALARLVAGDIEVARVVVADVLHSASVEGAPSRARTRGALATATFHGCRAVVEVASGSAGAADLPPSPHPVDRLARTSDQQRCAVALHLHGHLTALQIAILLDLSPGAVEDLLRAALGELSAVRRPT
ncbi:hypothetical protein [uncultured Nocardioides sp.]|uniref:hypothetical protein n=1 Tax=uncultured Nocardioides sp. TaxID=198441 RepID=UPI0026098C3E|nr:hypothetical protein [uncultured Nocardioides sp.]